jgi:hypothetical protein
LLLAALILPHISVAQFTSPDFVSLDPVPYSSVLACGEGMFLVEENGKTGIIDYKGKLIYPTKLDKTNKNALPLPTFTDGKIALSQDGKFGVIDKQGKVILPFQYEKIHGMSGMSKGVVTAKLNSGTSSGYVDLTGKQIIPNMYQQIEEFGESLLVRGGDVWGMMNRKGEWILQPEYTSTRFIDPKKKFIVLSKGSERYLIDALGKPLFSKDTSDIMLYTPSEGLVMGRSKGKIGFLNTKGAWVVNPEYDWSIGFNENGLAAVSKGWNAERRYGVIDKTGKLIVPLNYPDLGLGYYQNKIKAKDPVSGLYGYLDAKGQWVIQPAFRQCENFDAFGGVWAMKKDGKWLYIDGVGREMGGRTDGRAQYFSKDGLAVLEQNTNGLQLIDSKGNKIKDLPVFKQFGAFLEDRMIYQSAQNSLVGYITIDGELLGEARFGLASQDFSDGMAMVQDPITRKFGFINKAGELVIPMTWDTIGSFQSGKALFKKNGAFGLIDKKGNPVTLPRKYGWMGEEGGGYVLGKVFNQSTKKWKTYYIDLSSMQEKMENEYPITYGFSGDWSYLQKDWTAPVSFMNKKGEFGGEVKDVVQILPSPEGVYAVKQGRYWTYYDVTGKKLTDITITTASKFQNGFARISRYGSTWNAIDRNGKVFGQWDFEDIAIGEDGLINYKENYLWGVMDASGKKLSFPKYPLLSPFSKGRAVANPGKRYTIVKSPLLK